jgi:catechol 2,3-dioxygenase-like lactoylglutathione lyase family enzyme
MEDASMPKPEISINRTNTILYCEAFDQTVSFYQDILKLRVATQKDWFVEFRLSDRVHLSVADAGRTTIPAGKGEGITLSWQVEDVREARDRLAAMGVETSPVEWRYGAWVIYICDPAGNRIELWS